MFIRCVSAVNIVFVAVLSAHHFFEQKRTTEDALSAFALTELRF